MKKLSNRLNITFLIVVATLFFRCQNEDLTDMTIPDNFSLQDYKNETVRHHLQIEWNEHFSITIGTDELQVYKARLGADQEIIREGFLNSYDYHVQNS